MPRHPDFAPAAARLPGSVYSLLEGHLSQYAGEVYPLHVGDTYLPPPEGCRMEDLTEAEHPGLHRYAPVAGLPALLEAIAARTVARTGVPTAPGDVLVATGATGALGAVAGALLAPGDEVLVLAPHWPLFPGIVSTFHATPVPVDVLGVEAPEALAARVRARLTPRTAALYVNTPNNPTGHVLPRPLLEALVGVAREAGLWLLADEVYELYAYAGPHVPLRALAPERTFAVHSFSKAYGMAGNRLGWVVGPPGGALGPLRKVATHSYYSAPTAAQVAGARVLAEGRGDAWAERAGRGYREVGEAVAHRLGVPPPQGGTFLFLDVAAHLDGAGLEGLLERCVGRGLLLAPGPSFGPYPAHLRLCFTAAPPDVVLRGAEVLAQVLGR
jgi:N-succinyldiaminopimelate aminotransferase